MERVTYILGAGFSAPLGLPVMNNFVTKAKDLFALDPDKYQHFKKVFSTIADLAVIKNYINQDLHNIEDILSLMEMETFVGQRNFRQQYVKFIKDVIEYYTPKMPQVLPRLLRQESIDWPNIILEDGQLAPYILFTISVANLVLHRMVAGGRPFLQRAQNQHTTVEYSIVTLNYDRVIENILEFFVQGFQGQGEARTISISKLHGSVDGQIVPPTWNKSVSKEIAAGWRAAFNSIVMANHLRIIGYSLPITDNHIRYLLSVSLKQCENLKTVHVITLDPKGESRTRYKEMFSPFPNFRFSNASVEDYMSRLVTRKDGFGNKLYSFVQGLREEPKLVRSIIAEPDRFERAHNAFMVETADSK